jgi:flavin-dependent dehydrogenase
VDQTVYDNILLVGDVAGQVKATTGGGVIYGGLCAKIAGEVATKYLEEQVPLVNYDKLWRKKYGYELKTMQVLRKLLSNIGSDKLDRTLRIFKTENIEYKLKSLLETGDLDMQSNTIKKALFDPKILSILIKGIGKLALNELFSLFK